MSPDRTDTAPGGRTPAAGRGQRCTAYLLVGGQFAMLGSLVVLPDGMEWPLPEPARRAAQVAAGGGLVLAAVAASSLGRGATPLPLPNKRTQLRTGGLYRLVRHPIYSGVLLFAGGRAAGSGSRPKLLLFVALVALLTGKARFEEKQLRGRFPGYGEYASRTPRFLPGRRRHRSASSGLGR